MKFLLACLALTTVIALSNADLTEEQKTMIQDHGKACITETGVSEDLVEKAKNGDFAADQKLAAFAFCMSKKLGFQNDAGEIQQDTIKTKVTLALGDAAAVDKLIEQCVVAKDTPENTAAEVFKCYYTNTPTHISIV